LRRFEKNLGRTNAVALTPVAAGARRTPSPKQRARVVERPQVRRLVAQAAADASQEEA
jgi:hypothetical protein